MTSVLLISICTGYAEGHPTDNLLMEIKGYKFAQNKVSLCVVVVPLMLRLVP